MVKVGDINPMDRRFWPKEPEPGFSPERNRLTIENSIRKYELNRKRKFAAFTDALRERTDALASFLTSRKGAESGNSVDRYFGRRYLAHLRGEDIIDEIRGRLGVGSTPPTIKAFKKNNVQKIKRQEQVRPKKRHTVKF